MKLKRYIAPDMRHALRVIREEQGPDAVILSTRNVAEGVEVCAAVDLELAGGHGTLAETAALKELERAALQALERGEVPTAQLSTARTGGAPAASVEDGDQEFLSEVLARTGEADRGASVGDELRSLRALLEQQLAALAWNDFTRREPARARALADLAALGLERVLALQIVGDLPPGLSNEQMLRMPYALLARRIRTAAAALPAQGALALVGPAGCGKTTTLSKLATRYVLEHDAANLVILSTDDERLGSHEALRSLGRLLGVRVETVVDADALARRIEALPGRCVLIDTQGAMSREGHVGEQFRALRARCAALEVMLVLPASAQAGVLDQAVAQLGSGLASTCTLTRIDEAVSLGGVLSTLVRSQLPVAYWSEGPRIPEDLKPARSHQLVARAVELSRAQRECIDDDLLARRYGSSVHAAA
jgi:flagellar biosynthesis protein FlhF